MSHAYSKVEIVLDEICQRVEIAGDFFTPAQPAIAGQLMTTPDAVSRSYGLGALRAARLCEAPGWSLRRQLMIRRFTTHIDQVRTIQHLATGVGSLQWKSL